MSNHMDKEAQMYEAINKISDFLKYLKAKQVMHDDLLDNVFANDLTDTSRILSVVDSELRAGQAILTAALSQLEDLRSALAEDLGKDQENYSDWLSGKNKEQ